MTQTSSFPFLEEGLGGREAKLLAKFTQPVSGAAEIQVQVCLTPKLFCLLAKINSTFRNASAGGGSQLGLWISDMAEATFQDT